MDVELFEWTPKKRHKKWKREYGLICLSGEDLFVHPFMAGMTTFSAVMSCSFDGIDVLTVKPFKHLRAPVVLISLDWVAKEFPKDASIQDWVKKVRLIKKGGSNGMVTVVE